MTSILDSPSLPWDDGHVGRLHTLLSEAYDDPLGIKELVDRVRPKLAGGIQWLNQNGANAIWTQVMNNVAHANALRKLLDVVLADERVSGFHEEIRAIMDELDGRDQPGPGEAATLAPVDPVSMTGLAATLVTDLPRLADQLIERVQRLASGRGPLDTALAVAATTTTTRSIMKALNGIDDIGPGHAAETSADDTDNALRIEIRQQLDVVSQLLPKTAARPDDTTSAIGLAVAAGRLRASARRLADLRARQHRAQ